MCDRVCVYVYAQYAYIPIIAFKSTLKPINKGLSHVIITMTQLIR